MCRNVRWRFLLKRVPKSEGHLNRSFPGVKKGVSKGGGSEQGLKGKEGGKMREKGWEERGPKAHSKNSDFGTLRWAENARFKNGHARVETRVLKTLACRNGFWTSFKQW